VAVGRTIFKTRALASKACDIGRIQCGDLRAKPAREIHLGDMLQIENEGGLFQVEVLAISHMRGPAAVAQTLYRETEASREARIKLAEERKPCSNSRRCLNAGHPSAIEGASFSSVAEASAHHRAQPNKTNPACSPGPSRGGISILFWGLLLRQQALDLLFNHVLGHVTNNLIGYLAALEEQQCGNPRIP